MAPNEMSNKLISEGLLGIKERGEVEDTFDMIILIEAARRVLSIDGMIERPTVEALTSDEFGTHMHYVAINRVRLVFNSYGAQNVAEHVCTEITKALGMEGGK